MINSTLKALLTFLVAALPLVATANLDDGLVERARVIHAQSLTLDAHADIEIVGKPSMYVGPDGLSKVAPEKMRDGQLDAVVMALAVGPKPRNEQGFADARRVADDKLRAVTALVEESGNRTRLVKSPDALLASVDQGDRSIVLSLQNALIFGEDLSAIDYFFDQGVRMFALTHMGHNDFADSSRPLFNAATGEREVTAEHGGLSSMGVAAVGRFNALGAVIDVSQLSSAATLQVVAQSTAPVVASHSNARALTDVSRNLSDREIRRIAVGGGVVHVAPFAGYLFDSNDPAIDGAIRKMRREAGIDEDYLYPFELYWEIKDPAIKTTFLGGVRALLGPISLETMLDHIDHIVALVGVDHVGIGTDFNHGSGIPSYNDASESFNVTLGLLRRGYSASDIQKIWGGNFVRVWKAVEKQRTVPELS
ncbi:dipeptidase [Luminiphilus sp.]|nr:dipeptidase [Luminiphilus sp.]